MFRDEPMKAEDLTRIRDFEAKDPEYLEWKREKIEAAARHADEHPDDFLTEEEIWKKHGLAN